MCFRKRVKSYCHESVRLFHVHAHGVYEHIFTSAVTRFYYDIVMAILRYKLLHQPSIVAKYREHYIINARPKQ